MVGKLTGCLSGGGGAGYIGTHCARGALPVGRAGPRVEEEELGIRVSVGPARPLRNELDREAD